MQVEAARTNLIIITSMGLAMFLVGLFLYFNMSRVAPYMRYLLPLPPIDRRGSLYLRPQCRRSPRWSSLGY